MDNAKSCSLISIEEIAQLRFSHFKKWNYFSATKQLYQILKCLDEKYHFNWNAVDFLYHGPQDPKVKISTHYGVRISQLQHFFHIMETNDIILAQDLIIRHYWYHHLEKIEQEPAKYLTEKESFIREYARTWIILKENVWWRRFFKKIGLFK